MKKIICTTAVIGALTLGAVSAVWANGTEMLTAAPAAASGYTLTVDSEKLDADIFTSGGCIMLPLRATAEKLGFKIVWNEENQSIDLDNGEVNTKLYIGEDSYYMASSKAIGMSAPTALGAAPVLKGDKTYVPAGMFDILCGKGSVSVKDNSVVINKNANGETDNSVQIPNPWSEHKSVDDAKKALSFTAPIPAKVADGYELDYISTLEGKTLQLIYRNADDKEIMYRTAQGSDDISGDYNVYKDIKTVNAGEVSVTLRKNGEVTSALWTNGGMTYAVYSDGGLSDAEVIDMIKEIK